MKKLYILSFLGLALSAQAQNKNQPSAQKLSANPKPVMDYVATSPVNANQTFTQKNSNTIFNKTLGSWDTKIGTTMWVNQTGGAIYRRLLAYPDGKLSATWTASSEASGLSRGAGYNHYSNNAWGPSTGLRIEQQRTGFPSLVLSPTNTEVIISHRVDTSGRSGGLAVSQNTGIGSSDWNTNILFAPQNPLAPSTLWPHSAVSGDFLIVASVFQDSTNDQPAFSKINGVRNPMLVRRYQFSTNTWLQEDSILPGFDSSVTTRGRPDTYSIDANGSNVAIVYSDVFASTVIWKSTNSGASWTKTIIDTFPVANYEFDRDTLEWVTRTDGSPHLLVDNSGMAHYYSGKATFKDSVMNDASYTYTRTRVVGIDNASNDGILYWNEYTQTLRQIANTPVNALNGDSTILDGSFTNPDRRYEISIATWPSAGIDSSGKMYVIFSSLTPGDPTAENDALYRDIYSISSTDSGATWTQPTNLTSYIQTIREEVFPTIAKRVDANLHISYMLKQFPGTTGTGEVYDIRYLRVPTDRVDNGTVGLSKAANTLFTVNTNYPNPFKNTTIIPVNLTEKATVSLTVMNILGEVVYSKVFNNTNVGNNELEINGNFKSGFYFYNIEAGGFKTSGKMIAE